MHSRYTSALTILLSAAASAFPTPSSKGSFRLDARRSLSASNLEPRDSAVGHEGTIYDVGWYFTVLLGGQPVALNIDTGSSDLWTASTLMPSNETALVSDGYPLYNPNASSTFQEIPGYTYSLGYADGSSSLGAVGYENVSIGGASTTMAIGVAQNLSVGGNGDVTPRNTHGPVGLAFSAGNSIRPTPQGNFFDFLSPQLQYQQWSTFFRQDTTSFIEFGADVNTTLYTGSLTTVNVSNTSSLSTGSWSVHGVSFGLSGAANLSTELTRMEFDTGNPTFAVPQAVFDAWYGNVTGADSGAGTVPCNASLPDFTISFADPGYLAGPATVTIPGVNVIDDTRTDGDSCGTFLGVGDEQGGAVAGVPFFTTMYVVWQPAKPAMVFGTQADLSEECGV